MAKGGKKVEKAKAGKPGKKGQKAARKGGFGIKILAFLVLVLALLLLPSSMLLAAGMVPTLVAYLTDPDRRKTSAISVGVINLCGVLPIEMTLWQGQNSVPQAVQLLSRLQTWVIMYGAAALGSVIYYAVPPVVGGFIALKSAARVAELERRQKTLRESWGEEVAAQPHPARPKAVPAR